MKHRTTALAALVVLAACGEAPTEPSVPLELAPAFSVTAPTIANGSFEDGYTGWTFGDVDVVGTSTWTPSAGSRSLDLNGFNPGTISQDIATVPGVEYTVLFDLAGNPGDPQGPKLLQVEVPGLSAFYLFDTTGKSGTSMGWQAEAFTFTAIGTTTTLTFRSLHAPPDWGGQDGWKDRAQGPALDNIRLEAAADTDSDGILDDVDNCVATPNPDQIDTDSDGLGNACDDDDDNDGVSDAAEAILGTNPLLVDTDADTVLDGVDNCPVTANADQADMDGDNIGDVCDPDRDGDGVANDLDAFPDNPAEWADTDGDGVGDNADAFDNSDTRPTLIIGTCDSGVSNKHLGNGTWWSDLIAAAKASAKNHGKFVSAVAALTDGWKKSGQITGREEGAITSCAARSR